MKTKTNHLYLIALIAVMDLLVGCPVNPPANPSNLRLTSKSQTSLNLEWDASGGALSYTLERKTATSAFVPLAAPSLLTYADTGLTPSTSYTYRIRAVNSGGASGGTELTASTDAVLINNIGIVDLWENNQNQTVGRNAIGVFYSLNTPLSAAPINQFGIPLEECRFFAQPNAPKFVDLSPGGLQRTPLEAGNSPNIATTTATYATLERQLNPPPFLSDFYGNLIYAHSASPLGSLPTSAKVTIPGVSGGFPVVSADLPEIPNDFTLSASSGLGAITQNSTLTWTGTASAGSLFYLEGQSIAGASAQLYFRCAMTDDGSFGFTAQQKLSLPDTYKITLARRVINRTEVNGDSALVMSAGYLKNY
jgi:Fibronectin type III domain